MKFYEDPGHGWLEVPVAELKQLGIENEITSYSYQSRDGKLAYLEEDCDLTTYCGARGVKSLRELGAERVYQENTFIRSLPCYSPPMSEDERFRQMWQAEFNRTTHCGGDV